MSHVVIGGVGIGILLVLMFIGLPIWLAMIVTGFVGWIFVGGGGGLAFTGLSFLGTLRDNSFAVLPIFLLMGEFADISGMMRDAYKSAYVWFGKIPGGLAMASVVGAATFSLISGSSMATAAIMGRIALPQMLFYKYDHKLATGALIAGGTLGNLIPPGILLVIYAIVANVSIGKLFVACYIPGLLLAFMYMVQIFIQCKINPSAGPSAGRTTWKEKILATKGMVALIVVFGITLGGIQLGVFTPNEAASISTVFVFLFALARKTLNGQKLIQAFRNTLATTGMAIAVLVGANFFNSFIALSGLPQGLAQWMTGLHLSQTWVVILVMILFFIMGIPLNPISVILLAFPILIPVLNAYHIDLIWFGVLTIVQCELANITPPEGINLFVIAGMGKPHGISVGTVFRGALPFVVTCMVFIVIMIAFPQIAMFLVNLMKT